MRKRTIFYYEFKRLILSRTYLLLLAAIILYSISLLRSTVLFGVMYTAPFSQQTFSAYLSSLSPLLLVLLLLLCARQFTPSERGAAAIIQAAPLPEPAFLAIRYGAVACASLITAALSVLSCFLFYWIVFDYISFSALLWHAIVLLLPPAALVFGASLLLGRQKAAFIYILLAAVLVTGIFRISLPAIADVTGSSVTTAITAGNTVIFTPLFMIGRAAQLAAGTALVLLSMRHRREL